MLLSALALACVLGAPCPAPALPTDSAALAAARLAAVDHVMDRGVAAGGFPGAAVVIGRRDGIALARGYGRVDWPASSAPVSPSGTLYDLASLTKVVATTASVMVLYDQHRIDLDAPVQRYLPRFTGNAKSRVTIR